MNTLAQSTYRLRDYQQELFQKVFNSWSAGNRRLLMQLPTAGGKTVVLASIAQQFTQRGEGVLVLAHREELLLQAKEKLEAVTGHSAGVIKAGYTVASEHSIQIASVQSLIRRKSFPDAALVVVDEAHHSSANTYTTILNYYNSAYILGVTATPARSDGQGFKHIYDALILGRSVRELIDSGYLCRFKLFAAKKTVNTSNVKTTGGEYNQRELAEAIDISLVMGDLISTWFKHARGKKTVVFTIDIAHSIATAQAYNNVNIPAEHLDGETLPDERKAILERFRTGETLVLCNVGIVTEGFDVPSIEAIQCIRPTKSLILWLQMVGRGLRPSEGKDYCTIIDHTQNWFFHGLPDEEREWSLEPMSLKQQRFTLECPDCGHVFLALPHEQKPCRKIWVAERQDYQCCAKVTCPNCQCEFYYEYNEGGEPPPEREIILDEKAQLEEISLELNLEIMARMHSLKEQQLANNYKPRWVYHKLVEIYPNVGLGELRECAKLLGYQPGWGWYRWQELQQAESK